MKKIYILLSISVVLWSCGSSKSVINDLATDNPIQSQIDLTKTLEDKVPVVINPGRFTIDNVIYRLPKVIQGTYTISNFGSYIDDFKAYDYDGNELTIIKEDTNSWSINNATNLDKLVYYVNDTYDMESIGGIGGEHPFSPGGTNIHPENYVLNLHGFIGYFDSLKNNQYALDVISPSSFKRTSALQNISTKVSDDSSKTTTSYFAPRYFDITDNPMMYGNLDVEEFQVGDIKIVLSVYSPNKVHTAASIKETIFTMMQAQKAYLGDLDSTARYDIYLYLSDTQAEGSPKGFGALEHHTSTVVVLPEQMPKEALDKTMTDVVSHEFFHIVSPLNVHSEDVHYFDYNSPTFSKHLWMYEGITEYFANHFQVYEGLISEDEFFGKMMQKVDLSKRFDDKMSFTQMSENILDDPYAKNYINVYQKGALIGMCLDVLLHAESNGNRSMLSLMKELSNKYGKNKPFEDDKIIDEISAMTYPSVGEFLKTHVEGTMPINYEKILEKAGLIIGESKIKTNYIQNGGNLIISGDQETGTIFFTDAVTNNSFWNDQGVKPSDVIKSVNGTELSLINANQIFQQVFLWQPGQDIDVVLDRDGEVVNIKTKLTQSYSKTNGITPNPDATQQQIDLRKAWLKG